MGIWSRFWEGAQWVWSRYGDYNTLGDLIELLGWKTQWGAVLSAGLTAAGVAWSEAPWWASLLAAIFSAILVLLGSIRWQLRGGKQLTKKTDGQVPSDTQSSISIEFNPMFSEWRMQQEPGNTTQTYRRVFWINIKNVSEQLTLKNVRVIIERIEQIPDRPYEPLPPDESLGAIGSRLVFDAEGKKVMDFPPLHIERVSLVSHSKSYMLGSVYRIEGALKDIHHNNRQHRIHLSVTAENPQRATKRFRVWVESGTNILEAMMES